MCYGQDLIFFKKWLNNCDFNIEKKNVKMWLSGERRRNRQSGVMAVTLSLLPWLQARERREGDYCDVLCLCDVSPLTQGLSFLTQLNSASSSHHPASPYFSSVTSCTVSPLCVCSKLSAQSVSVCVRVLSILKMEWKYMVMIRVITVTQLLQKSKSVHPSLSHEFLISGVL